MPQFNGKQDDDSRRAREPPNLRCPRNGKRRHALFASHATSIQQATGIA